MALPTLNDVTAVDPVLTNLLIGYMQDEQRFAMLRAAPAVSVSNDAKSGTYYKFDKKYWFQDGLEERAPGGSFEDLLMGVSTATYDTIQYAGQRVIPDEVRAGNQAPMDLETAAVQQLAQMSLIRKERQLASEAFSASVWTTEDNDSTTDWDDTTSGDPVGDIDGGARTISNLTGYMPNTLLVGYIVHNALKVHPDILDRIKYTSAATGEAAAASLAAIFEIDQYLVSRASYNSANVGLSASMSAIIDDDALLFYNDPNSGVMGATAMKTFVWNPGGGAGQVFNVRHDEQHRNLIQYKEQWDLKVVAADLGAIWLGVV